MTGHERGVILISGMLSIMYVLVLLFPDTIGVCHPEKTTERPKSKTAFEGNSGTVFLYRFCRYRNYRIVT